MLAAIAPPWTGAPLTTLPAVPRLIVAAVVGGLLGLLLRVWLRRLATPVDRLGETGLKNVARSWSSAAGPFPLLELVTAGLVTGYIGMVTLLGVQQLPEQGHPDWLGFRIALHVGLIVLLLAATFVDLWEYIIPDEIVLTGLAAGFLAGALVQHVHLVPLWIDWNQEHPITGPYIPEWMKQYSLAHGLAVAACGAVVAAGGTWLLRLLSAWVLGQEALGFGDVTLMAMIGSILGWQASLCVLLLAPLVGVVVALLVRVQSGRVALPFGPFLAVAAIVVLCTWKWMWLPGRLIFGHWPSLLGLFGGAAVALILLLGLVRGLRALPTR
jgi:leader peptidase (prepilin peptidase) / N-methyltransferase